MIWMARRRFLVLFIALIVLLVGYPPMHEIEGARLLFDAMGTAVFIAGLLVAFRKRYSRVIGLLLGIPTLVGAWTGYVFPNLPRLHLAFFFHLFAAVFLVVIAVAILAAIFNEEKVSADSIYGALCGYLLTGLAFGHIYCVIEILAPGSFHGPAELVGRLQEPDHRHFVLSYFSFVTLTTVGYGDITPGNASARAWAIVEAIVGQFYIAVLVAELIGKRVGQVIADREAAARR
jgi:Ion channel